MAAFETPMIITPDQGPDEFDFELDRMLRRADATRAWQMGQISTADWMDAMDELGVDVIQASTDWAQGVNYI
ncbi:hypothetical protein [Geitlerinema sp. PCC 7407]|uniref:hypothetical protein n=1 Tax=Geitlerinema sp. PCC 7407 TaxID=1173025 RepID=UPI00029FFE32|nr:hypothetical protein [Geitlerinema sp. PCC 7407]AFY64682.1 serine--glyoxylate transaminase [Geitlerinema sp. PCC 7407]